MAKSIVVYTTATCGYCKMLKNYLDQNNFPYQEKRVDLSREEAQAMVEKSGQMGVPFTVITNEKGEEQGILGFDKTSIQHALLN